MTLSWARPNQAGKAASGKSPTRARLQRRRHGPASLLPVLHAIQNRIGWISPGALNYVALRLDVAPAEVHGVASFYGMFSLQPRPRVVAHVCDDIACVTRGSDKLCAELEGTLGPAGSPCSGGRATWLRSQCLGLCERAPAALVSSAGEQSRERVLAPASADAVQSLLNDAVQGRLPAEPDVLKVPDQRSPGSARRVNPRLCDFFIALAKVALRPWRPINGSAAMRVCAKPWSLALKARCVSFPLQNCWAAAERRFPPPRNGKRSSCSVICCEKNRTRAHYVVCNADESEPGTFKDRVLMEGDPFAVLEGMTIAGFVTGARQGYIYLRGEYPLAAAADAAAIESANENGFLGDNILGSGLQFNIEIRRGAGAYICGEETALFNSIEGYRGEPRNKPPFPTQSGLFRQPTVVNNVETLVNVPGIIREGGAAYAKLGTDNSAGHPALLSLRTRGAARCLRNRHGNHAAHTH